MQNFDFNFTVQDDVNFNMETGGNVGGVANYNLLDNKPQINGVTLQGNKSGSDLGLDDYTDLSNKPSINGVALSGNKASGDIKIPFLTVTGETYTIDGTQKTAAFGAGVMVGGSNKAVGAYSLALGSSTTALGNMAISAGAGTKANGDYSFAVGMGARANGESAFSQGSGTSALGNYSAAFGAGSQSVGMASFSVNSGNLSNGKNSFTAGTGTVANSDNQFVIGKNNIEDSYDRFAFIIGNGAGHNEQTAPPSNALAIGWDGKIYTGNNSQGINLETFYSAYLLTVAALSAVSDKTDENRDELAEIVDAGAKNLLNPENAVGYVGQSAFPISKSGITYTLDANSETITLSDTATSVSTLRIPITLKAGTYHVSGIPSGGSDSSYRVDLREAGGNTFITSDFDYGSGFSFTLSETTSLDYCIRIANGYSPSSVVVSPMICTEAAWSVSQQFVKYRPSYDELITRIEALEQANGISTNAVSQSRGIKTIEDI